jgi:hypothetical protein
MRAAYCGGAARECHTIVDRSSREIEVGAMGRSTGEPMTPWT